MKLFLFIALAAIVAIVIISLRGGPRITTIERRRERDDDDA
jgi:hypothetical protein